MAVHAYVLIQTDVGHAADVVRAISQLEGVVQAEGVTGPYDVIARVEADSIDELGRLVVTHVQSIAGLTRTLTCPVVNL